MKRRELIGGVRLEAEQLTSFARPRRASGMGLIGRQRARHDAAIAEAMEDRLAAIELDPANDVRMVPEHDVAARIDRSMRKRPFVRGKRAGVCTMPL